MKIHFQIEVSKLFTPLINIFYNRPSKPNPILTCDNICNVPYFHCLNGLLFHITRGSYYRFVSPNSTQFLYCSYSYIIR